MDHRPSPDQPPRTEPPKRDECANARADDQAAAVAPPLPPRGNPTLRELAEACASLDGEVS